MKKRAILLSSLITVIVMISSFAVFTPQNANTPEMKNAQAYERLLSVIESYNTMQNSFNPNNIFGSFKSTDAVNSAPELADSAAGRGSDYSETNVQTAGVDEGDIVKVDGQYIYKLSTNGCFIIRANNGALSLASKIEIENYVPQELYVLPASNQLVMIGGIYEQFNFGGRYEAMPMYDCMAYFNYNKTDIRIYDISDRTSPVLQRQITVDGSYYTSRLMTESNELLYMVNYYFYYGNQDTYIPKLSDSEVNSGEIAPMPIESIYYYEDIPNYSYLVLGKINLSNPANDSEISAFLGLDGTIYVSTENIYVATYDYMSTYKRNIWGWVTFDSNAKPMTRLVRISIADLKQKAAGRIEGMIKDRYSLDEYGGHLRAATNNWSYSLVFVLNMNLETVGKIDKIAEGEAIYSVRFNQDKLYLVTFEQVDPYFIIDLSDPAKPTIKSELKKDGVSYYVHAIEGTPYTIGVGRNTRVIQNPYGGTWVQFSEIEVVLYDNSGDEAKIVKIIYLPFENSNWSGYSELFYNPKALLYNKDRGLFAFTYEIWSYDYNYYYSSMKQGLAVFKFDSAQEEDGDKLIYKGTLNNQNGEGIDFNYYNSWDTYYETYFTFINRGVQIGDYIYTVSDKFITSYSIDTLAQIDKINLHTA